MNFPQKGGKRKTKLVIISMVGHFYQITTKIDKPFEKIPNDTGDNIIFEKLLLRFKRQKYRI